MVNTPRHFVDERRRIMEGFSDDELLLWLAMFGSFPPVRIAPERKRALMKVAKADAVGDVFWMQKQAIADEQAVPVAPPPVEVWPLFAPRRRGRPLGSKKRKAQAA